MKRKLLQILSGCGVILTPLPLVLASCSKTDPFLNKYKIEFDTIGVEEIETQAVEKNSSFSTEIRAKTGYILPETIEVIVNGVSAVDGTDYEYKVDETEEDRQTATLSIDDVKGDVVIKIYGIPTQPDPEERTDGEKGQLLSVADGVHKVKYAGLWKDKNDGHEFFAEITPQEMGCPIINVDGSLVGISKDNPVPVDCVYYDHTQQHDFTTQATIKLQGNSSVARRWDKQNYTIDFYEDGREKKQKFKLQENWPKMNKITLKGNWIDAIQTHNVVSAKIWGQVVHTIPDPIHLDNLLNGGAIDGYPVAFYNNGQLMGFYTLNWPKNKIMFDMGKDETPDIKEVILSTRYMSNSTAFKGPINTIDPYSDGWEPEYCSTGDEEVQDYLWALKDINKFINYVVENHPTDQSTDEEIVAFKAGLSTYVEVDRLLDYFLFCDFGYVCDNYAQNVLWVKYNDTKWFPSAYDMDFSWGFGTSAPWIMPYEKRIAWNDKHLLFGCINKFFKEELKTRYWQLRENGVYTKENIVNMFYDFQETIPPLLQKADDAKYPKRYSEPNCLENMADWVEHRIIYYDTKMFPKEY